MNLLDDLLDEVKRERPDFPLEPLKRAFELANKSHGSQIRKSGEPYIVHPVAVVRILLHMNVDLPALIAGLLHDTVEDTHLSLDEIEKEFGKDVAFLVDGVTKLSKLSFKSSHRAQAENFRKMILAMGKDIRVILIKLADRLHNMRTLQHMKEEKQISISQETNDIYAPLANRLGINWVKVELQDICLRYLHPDVYFKLVKLVARTKAAREKYIQEVIEVLRSTLEESNLTDFEITGRPKSFFSIYSKMEKSNLSFEEINDLLAFRILCEDIRGCYQSLGVVHSMWKPVPGRFKDYIAMPKANLYQSLHTTVVGPNAERIEVQIRTHEMNQIAEHGIAAHWTYKADGSVEQSEIEKFAWVRKLVEEQTNLDDPSEFLESLKGDLFDEEVFVFTPRGDVVALPSGACPIDLAYAVHSAVGDHCVGAKINGRIVPLKHKLESGDEVEIITSEGQNPRKDWLDFVITSKARAKIRGHVKKAQREQSQEMGQKLLEREFRKKKLNFAKYQKSGDIEKACRQIGAANEEDLLIKVGYGKMLAPDVVKHFMKHMGMAVEEESVVEKTPLNDRPRRRGKGSDRSPVLLDGLDHLLVRFAKCCKPIPGEPIVGFVSRGKGIMVHHAECAISLNLDDARKFDLEWDPGRSSDFKVGVKVTTMDRQGMLASITQTISSQEANITNAKVHMGDDGRASILFEVGLRSLPELQKLLTKIEGIDGVIKAERCRF